MKKIRMGLMAIVALSGVGSAFAFSPKPNSVNYYARQVSGSSFRWTTTTPNPNTAACSPQLNDICQISTDTPPPAGEIPSGHTATNMVFKAL